MESGLNGNSKTIDNNSSSLGYRSFKGLPQKNQYTIDHGGHKPQHNIEPAILSTKETMKGFAMRAVNERSKKYQKSIPVRDQDAEFVRHGSAGIVSAALDHSMNDGALINPE